MSPSALDELHGVAAIAILTVSAFAIALPDADRRGRVSRVSIRTGAALLLCTTQDLGIALLALAGFRSDLAGRRDGLVAILLAALGLAFALAASGSTELPALASAIADSNPRVELLARIALALTLAGFAPAASIAPFHRSPRVLGSRERPSDALLRLVLVRSATLFFLAKLLPFTLGPHRETWQVALWSLAVLSMLQGEIIALRARSLEAWMDGISMGRSGLVLAALLGVSHLGASAALLALAVDGLALLALFALTGSEAASSSASARPGAAPFRVRFLPGRGMRIAVLLCLASLSAMPGTLGLLPRLLAFQAAAREGFELLAATILSSGLLSLLGWIRRYRDWPPEPRGEARPLAAAGSAPIACLGAAVAILLLAGGLAPAGIFDLVHDLTLTLP